MAQVPYDPVPQGAPGPLPTEGPRVDLPGALLAPAQATERAGQQVGQAGNELFQTALQIQNLKNENTARQTGIAATGEMSDVFAKFDALEGQARADAFPKMRADLEAIRQKYRANLNPMAARMFDQDAASLQNSFTRYGALQAGRGIKDAAVSSAKAKVDLITNNHIDNNDDNEFNKKKQQLQKEIYTQVANGPGGYNENAFQDAVQQATSKLWRHRIDVAGGTDPELGYKYLNEAMTNNELTDVDQDYLSKYLRVQNINIGADNLALTIHRGGGLMRDKEAKAEELAPTYARGDPEFLKHVVMDLHKYDELKRSSDRNEVFDLKQNVANMLQSGSVNDYNSFRATPQGQQIVSDATRLDPAYALRLPQIIDNWNKSKNVREKLERMHELITMADDEPEKLMQVDPMEEIGVLGQSGVKAVWKMQQTLQKEGRMNPRLNQAYNDLYAQYPNEVPNRTVDPEGYQQYKGALYQALQVRQGMEMKPLTPEDYKNIHHMLMQRVTNSRFAGLWSTNTPMYKMDIPPEFAELAREKDPNISEDEIRNNWFAGQSLYFFNRLHGRAREGLTKPRPRIEAGTPPPTITPASAPTPLPPTSPVNIRGRPLTGEDIQKVSEDVQKGLKALSKAAAEPGGEAAGLTEGPTASSPIKRRSPGEEIH